MVVLVTGAAGFIGSHVVHLLLSKGYAVRATVRKAENARFLDSFPTTEHSTLEIIEMDLLDAPSVTDAVQGCDAIIHCAASLMINVKDAQRDVVDPSVIGTQNLCDAIQQNPSVQTVIHTSSVAAIRKTKYDNGQVFNASDWCDDATLQSNAYGLAKAQAERKMRDFVDVCNGHSRAVRLVTIHPSIVFGPVFHQRHTRGSMAYLKHFTGKLPFVIRTHLNFVDVRDVADAHVNALERGDDGGRYILHKTGLWMSEIGTKLRQEIPGKKWATLHLPTPLAVLMAAFHPKLTIQQVRSTVGRHVDYDTGDAEEKLGLAMRSVEQTLVDAVKSLND